MAHFYGSMEGSRPTPVTRCGTKSSGLNGHLRGWDLGAKVFVSYNEATDSDRVTVWLTAGSNGAGHDVLLFSGTRQEYEALRDEVV